MVKMKDDAAALLGQIIALATRGKGHRAFGQITRIAKRALGEVPTPQPRPVRELPDVVQVVARHIDSINHKLARGERVVHDPRQLIIIGCDLSLRLPQEQSARGTV